MVSCPEDHPRGIAGSGRKHWGHPVLSSTRLARRIIADGLGHDPASGDRLTTAWPDLRGAPTRRLLTINHQPFLFRRSDMGFRIDGAEAATYCAARASRRMMPLAMR